MTATTANTTSSMMLSRLSTTNVWNGGVRNQFAASDRGHGRADARPPPADRRDHDDGEQVEQQDAAEADVLVEQRWSTRVSTGKAEPR